MTGPSLEGRLQRNGSASHMLQNAQVGAYVFPIPPQYTNWVEEVRAWRNGAVLLNQSYHTRILDKRFDHRTALILTLVLPSV